MRKEEFVIKNSKFKTKFVFFNTILQTKSFVIFKNWCFQGIFDLSYQEKIYKIMLDVILMTLYCTTISFSIFSLFISFVISHTINWITNDHFVDNLCHLEIIKMDSRKMIKSITFLKNKIKNKKYIVYGGIYGRISRGEDVHSGTDIDIRLIKARGFFPSLKICFLGHYLRFVCLTKFIPIDLNIWNSKNDLFRMREDENPLIIKDKINVQELYKNLDIKLLPKYRFLDIRPL